MDVEVRTYLVGVQSLCTLFAETRASAHVGSMTCSYYCGPLFMHASPPPLCAFPLSYGRGDRRERRLWRWGDASDLAIGCSLYGGAASSL